MACPGRIVMESAFPDTGNEHSDAGTAMHEVASRVLTQSTGQITADDYIGDSITVDAGRSVTFTEEMAQLVDGYVAEVREIAQGGELHVEQRVEFSEFVGVPESFGTADVIVLKLVEMCSFHKIIVGDLKTGYHFVPVEENSQLMLYALGAYRQFELAYDIREVELIIFQPNNGGTRRWSCSIEALLEFAEKAREAAQQVEAATIAHTVIGIDNYTQEDWERLYLHPNPNEIDCAFCRAMSTCPAKQRKLEDVVGAGFDVVITDRSTGQRTATTYNDSVPLTHVDMMTVPVDKLARAMDCAGEFEDWIKAVRAEVERRLLLGQEVPGWGLELGREGARQWIDPEAAEAYLRKTARLKIEHVYDMKLVSPTTIERLAGYKQGHKVKNPKTPPVVGETQWLKLQRMVKRSKPSPSVKRIEVIKTPYLPLAPDASGFDNEEEDLT